MKHLILSALLLLPTSALAETCTVQRGRWMDKVSLEDDCYASTRSSLRFLGESDGWAVVNTESSPPVLDVILSANALRCRAGETLILSSDDWWTMCKATHAEESRVQKEKERRQQVQESKRRAIEKVLGK